MNINQLRYVQGVIETGSFSKAAALCCVTQPTLSNAVAQLEDELGNKIFVRTTRRVTLSAFGVRLLPFIEAILLNQSSMKQAAWNYQHPLQVVIRIGVSPLINLTLVKNAAAQLSKTNTHVEFIFEQANMAELEERLRLQELELIFVPVSLSSNTEFKQLLYEEPLCFLASGSQNNYPVDRPISLSDIARETFVLVAEGCGLSRTTKELFKSQHLQLNEYEGRALSYHVLAEWAALGVGAAILPHSKIIPPNLQARPLASDSGEILKISYEVRGNKNSVLDSLIRDFVQHLNFKNNPTHPLETAPLA